MKTRLTLVLLAMLSATPRQGLSQAYKSDGLRPIHRWERFFTPTGRLLGYQMFQDGSLLWTKDTLQIK